MGLRGQEANRSELGERALDIQCLEVDLEGREVRGEVGGTLDAAAFPGVEGTVVSAAVSMPTSGAPACRSASRAVRQARQSAFSSL